ncbi:MAG TPA: TetR-like C-terminal domain-containing protein, partial [Clostridia bacterium]|nr:TetR-like C-terminal domain-containing protein [Clostridia bacterium]
IAQEHILARLEQEAVDARAYKYIAAQISAVLISVIETWIESDFQEPIEFMAELTEALMYRPDSGRG